ncbi:hypothetical protein FOZ60_009013 [Perkinsus olseni]|uniref:Uncharacterized protein n=1 Tax=Perkinsus olseni TaxID=32597 RepID=A0A7J6NHY4_PEROL|nr:hypothetical protein FOZ60_009013 [Perkinsus olseni]
MTFILSLIISAPLFIAASASLVGKYFSPNESVNSLPSVDNSWLTPYYSLYFSFCVEVDICVTEPKNVELMVRCRALDPQPSEQEVTVNLRFEPDARQPASAYVIGPEEIEVYNQFKEEFSAVYGFEISPDDFKTMTFVTPTTAYTQLAGQRLTLSTKQSNSVVLCSDLE